MYFQRKGDNRMTVLESILTFTRSSIASGITWDVLKCGGEKIISLFKKQFIKNGSFNEESQCDEFFESIANIQTISKKKPYIDVNSIYEEISGETGEKFIEIFKQWITDNIDQFDNLLEKSKMQKVSVKIEHQENSGSGTIINAGIINNN